MNNLKFELIIAYYKRPEIVLNALESIKKSGYENWHLTFIDDSGDDSFKETFLNYGFDFSKISYVPILMSDDEKIKIGNSIFGKYINDSIIHTDADIIILICDDDALLPDYMEKLNDFYTQNPEVMYAYCHLKFYNPEIQKYTEASIDPDNDPISLNKETGPIMPFYVIDSSQASFRREAFTSKNVWYPYPWTAALDAYLFDGMYKEWGPCHFINDFGQCKAVFSNNLSKRLQNNSMFYNE